MFVLLFISICKCLITDVQFDSDFSWSMADIVTNNNTYRIMNLSQHYYYINITLQKKDVAFYLFAQSGQPIDSYTEELQDSISVDWSGQFENRETRFLKIEAKGSIIYLTTTGKIHQQYNITVRGSNSPICSNDCSNNGKCYSSGCTCDAQYIGDDCHQEAQEVPFNQDIAFYLEPLEANFYYTNIGQQDQQDFKFIMSFETNSSDGLYVFIEKTDFLYLPIGDTYTPNFQQYVGVVALDSSVSKQASIAAANSSQLIFAAIQLNPYEQVYLKISFVQGQEPSTTSSMAVIIIVVTIATAIIIIIIVICVCRRMRRERIIRSLSEHRILHLRIAEMAPIKQLDEEQIINCLALVKESDLVADDNCAICLESLLNKMEVRQTPCHHNFHSKCLRMWLEKHLECPNCRASLHLKDLHNHKIQ